MKWPSRHIKVSRLLLGASVLLLLGGGCAATHSPVEKRIETLNKEIVDKGYETKGRPYNEKRYNKAVR